MSKKQPRFMDLYLEGRASAEDINESIDAWHGGSGKQPIYDYLGMTEKEYSLWLRDPDVLPQIARARKQRKPLAEIMESPVEDTPTAASSPNASEARDMSIDALTNEIKNALRAKLWYAALVMALTLPDVCAALESKDGRSTPDRYKAWCDHWLNKKYHDLMTADDLYFLRCGVAHQAKFVHPAMNYKRIFFTLRPNGQFFHMNVLNGALNLDLVWFCKDVVESVEEWFAKKGTDSNVQANLANLVKFHPQGMLPYLQGVPAVG